MKFRTFSHRHALQILENTKEYSELLREIFESLENVTEERLIEHFQYNYEVPGKAKKSISESINKLLKSELVIAGWRVEAPIFRDADFGEGKWRLDFAKSCKLPASDSRPYGDADQTGISMEVAFNHSGSIAWNLLKPVLASELNHVEKAIQTSVGVVVTATRALQEAGGFDGAIGVYEDYVSHLIPLRDVLTVPILIIGLEAPETFVMRHEKRGTTTYGLISKN
ncbi:hypothetical protein [Candidatus Aquiluna sp. UB-MaderosW2red]|uniref:hypothetical protein n=1 Tax=Candidatus Aquiluna sp. UB-MaderosW2red TaxID=1855377 RepID=UPI000875E6D7|nr:hypothetical protein [Candidatus Aquiluna sp. UB-MaderosW2red]SCX13491.1 Restriction endonuclease BglII [Candidatus Aquiluna sp. UB-MaderosW2red]